ncbi:lipopolysaccharide biosynthesis protein [Cellulomonas sp. PSBB021]|uniref:lipopolysaccharide biosynthesis protein n=1 Tax=Cellulomonas sp. PSBB021 TaxID=2003551 RepID=UPI0012FD6CD1|nr:oligosaccharide flippase family protein [Cellulomonas sp. PSBB021]
MFGAGAPNIIAAALLMVSPLVGQAYLSTDDYAVWALSATVVTISAVFDLGAPAYVARATVRGGSVSRALALGWGMTLGASAVVGAFASAVWPWYAERAGSVGDFDQQVAPLFIAAAGASGIRGMFVVTASVLMAQGALKMRATLILAQAVAQLGILVAALRSGAGLWALCIAVGSTGLVAWVVASWLAIRLGVESRGEISAPEARRFAGWRTVTALIGMLLTQGDRWAVGLVASPEVLGSYDIAARLASIPRVLAINFSVVLVVDAVNSRVAGGVATLYRQSLRIVALMTALVTAGVLVVVRVVEGHIGFVGRPDWVILGVISVAYAVNACTAPATQMTAGLGEPQVELRYLLPCLVGTVALWTVGSLAGSPATMIIGSAASLAVTSAWFALRDVPRRLAVKDVWN